jgi:hypothetical protein
MVIPAHIRKIHCIQALIFSEELPGLNFCRLRFQLTIQKINDLREIPKPYTCKSLTIAASAAFSKVRIILFRPAFRASIAIDKAPFTGLSRPLNDNSPVNKCLPGFLVPIALTRPGCSRRREDQTQPLLYGYRRVPG